MRLIFALICSAFGLFMLIIRNKGKGIHKEPPIITVEKAFTVVCFIFSIIVVLSNVTGNIISNSLLNSKDDCFNRCEKYPPLNPNNGDPAYLCSHRVLDGKCEKYEKEISYEESGKYYSSYILKKCDNVYLCYVYTGSKSLDVAKAFYARLTFLIIISVAAGIYWLVIIFEWFYMIKYAYNGNPDLWTQIQPQNRQVIITREVNAQPVIQRENPVPVSDERGLPSEGIVVNAAYINVQPNSNEEKK